MHHVPLILPYVCGDSILAFGHVSDGAENVAAPTYP